MNLPASDTEPKSVSPILIIVAIVALVLFVGFLGFRNFRLGTPQVETITLQPSQMPGSRQGAIESRPLTGPVQPAGPPPGYHRPANSPFGPGVK